MVASTGAKKRLTVLAALLLAAGVTGCRARVPQVSGRVCYAGQPLTGGSIVLFASDGQPHQGQIDTDGRFSIPDVPAGEARVSVSSLVEATPRTGKASTAAEARCAPPAAVYSRIPERYADLGRSGLTVRVEQNSSVDLNLP